MKLAADKAVVQWLRHCATNLKVAGSIPDGIRIFHWHNPSGRTMASNRNEYQECFLGVKSAGAQGWQPWHLHVPIVMKSGSLNLLEPSGPVKACKGIALPLPLAADKRLSFFCRLGAGPSTLYQKAHVTKYYIEYVGNLYNQQPHNTPHQIIFQSSN
jgi:hypothetical protein